MPTTFAKATLKLEILKQERKFCTPKGRKYLLLIFMYIFLGITNPYTYLLHSKLSMTEFPYGLESNVFGMSGMAFPVVEFSKEGYKIRKVFG